MQKEDKEIGLLMKYGFQKQSFSIGLSGIQVYRSFFRPVWLTQMFLVNAQIVNANLSLLAIDI